VVKTQNFQMGNILNMGIGHLIMGYFVNVGNDTLINLEKLKNKNYRYIIDSVLKLNTYV
jgi:hypothetical protein